MGATYVHFNMYLLYLSKEMIITEYIENIHNKGLGLQCFSIISINYYLVLPVPLLCGNWLTIDLDNFLIQKLVYLITSPKQ